MRGLRDKVAIVTGGGGAIGRAIARRLADEAVVVGIFDRDANSAAETVRVVQQAGGRALAQTVDITDYAAVQQAVRDIEAQNGPTDILVNNAGWDQAGNFLDTSPAVWEQLIAINLGGPLNLHHVVLKGMVARRRGRVVNIASDAARVGSSGEAVYAAAKAGVIAFTKTVARELASLHRYAAVGLFCRRRRGRPKTAGGSRAGNPFQTAGTARRHCGDRSFFGQRRGRLYHRPGDQCFRRTYNARLACAAYAGTDRTADRRGSRVEPLQMGAIDAVPGYPLRRTRRRRDDHD